LGGKHRKILDLYYKIEHTSHHWAQFCGDRPTKLEDLMAKKDNNNNKRQQNISLLRKLSRFQAD